MDLRNLKIFFVRIDILERLFMQIINSEKEVKIIPEMLNLLGCNKEDFKELLKNMGYKIIERENDTLFKYQPKKEKKTFSKKAQKESPFGVLKKLSFN